MRVPRSDGAVAALLAAAAVLAYELASLGRATPFDYFGQLAAALVDGRWWLADAPARLSELVPCGDGRFCVAYPPLPAVLTLPFLTLLPPAGAQTLASIVVGGLSAVPTYLGLRKFGAPVAMAALTTVFAFAGTGLLYAASTGSAWTFAHAAAVLFASTALLLALDGRPGWLVGAALGAAALARPPVALASLGLAVLVARRRGEAISASAAAIVLGLAPFVAIELAYDVLRWGAPVEAGYQYLAAPERNDQTPHGLFSPLYVPAHLYAIVLRPPEIVPDGPFVLRPSLWGTSLVLVSPAFLFLVPAIRRRRDDVSLALLAAGGLALLSDLLHGGVGAAQFGYRFWLDAQPFLLPLVASGAAWRDGHWERPTRGYALAVGWSVLANLYGIAAIRADGFA